MNLRSALVFLGGWLSSAAVLAAVITVGPDEALTRIADAARIAQDGDTVLIKPGTYRGDVAVWTQKQLEIRGDGARPLLLADGQVAEDKAIWVLRHGSFTLRNIEFRGARARNGNGAGIRFERGSLTVQDCVFEDNEMGILTGNHADSELHVRDSVFGQAPTGGPTLHHLLYVGRIERFSVSGSRFYQGFRGHLLKSRARVSEVRYNWLADSSDGSASYELEFAEGGLATVIGNVIVQSPLSENPAMLAYGAEVGIWPEHRLLLAHNTFINRRDGGIALKIWPERLSTPLRLVTRNNLLVGAADFDATGEHRGNHLLPADSLAATTDDTLATALAALPLPPVEPAGSSDGIDLTPTTRPSFPTGTAPLEAGSPWQAGAMQR